MHIGLDVTRYLAIFLAITLCHAAPVDAGNSAGKGFLGTLFRARHKQREYSGKGRNVERAGRKVVRVGQQQPQAHKPRARASRLRRMAAGLTTAVVVGGGLWLQGNPLPEMGNRFVDELNRGKHLVPELISAAHASGREVNRPDPMTVRTPVDFNAPGVKIGRSVSRSHDGADIPAKFNTPVVSAISGKVAYVGWAKGYGRTVMVWRDDGVMTVYAHLKKYASGLKWGKRINAGDAIGGAGDTGKTNAREAVLHFEWRINSRWGKPNSGDPVDPLKQLREAGFQIPR